MDDEDKTNIFKFGAISGGKDEETEDKIPHNDYVIIDNDGNEFDVNGFLIFTPNHLAVMQDVGAGAIPALVLPLGRVKVAALAAVLGEPEDEALPF